MAQIDDLQTTFNNELFRRSPTLTNSIVAYDASPNLGGAPAILQAAPLGTWFYEETAEIWWRKRDGTPTGWVDQSGGGTAAAVSETTGNLTFTVATTGSDTPTPTRPDGITEGDFTSEPFLTIQAAINALPPIWREADTVTVNVGIGNFAGFKLTGKMIGSASATKSTINGTRIVSTLAQGSNSGTATSGTTRSMTLTGAGWLADDLMGRLVEITAGTGSGQILMIAANDTDTVTFAGPVTAPDVTSVFQIVESGTILNVATATAAGIHCESVWGRFGITDFKVTAATTFGLIAISCSGRLDFDRIVVDGQFFGFLGQECMRCSWDQIAALNCAGRGITLLASLSAANANTGWLASNCDTGFWFESCTSVVQTGAYSRDSTTYGAQIISTPLASLDDWIVDTAPTGIRSQTALLSMRRADISNCSIEPFDLFSTFLLIQNSLSGTGNTGFGIDVEGAGNTVEILITPTLTGASGDATVDGTAVLTWATNFAVSRDSALDIATGARIVRR